MSRTHIKSLKEIYDEARAKPPRALSRRKRCKRILVTAAFLAVAVCAVGEGWQYHKEDLEIQARYAARERADKLQSIEHEAASAHFAAAHARAWNLDACTIPDKRGYARHVIPGSGNYFSPMLEGMPIHFATRKACAAAAEKEYADVSQQIHREREKALAAASLKAGPG